MTGLTRLAWLIPLLVVATPSAFAAPRRSVPAVPEATVLIGQSWLGLWRGGRVVLSRAVDGWTFGAARLSRDGRTVEVAANRADAAESGDTILRFDARTLAPRGQGVDATLAAADVRAPIGVDPDVPDDRAALMQTGQPRLPRIKPSDRVVLSPDGTVVALFVKPAQAGAVWRGVATQRNSARTLTSPGLSIDDGSQRENGAARALACLLPRGEGAIFTYIGQPADRASEFQSFAAHARPVVLRGPYVMSCLARPGS